MACMREPDAETMSGALDHHELRGRQFTWVTDAPELVLREQVAMGETCARLNERLANSGEGRAIRKGAGKEPADARQWTRNFAGR